MVAISTAELAKVLGGITTQQIEMNVCAVAAAKKAEHLFRAGIKLPPSQWQPGVTGACNDAVKKLRSTTLGDAAA